MSGAPSCNKSLHAFLMPSPRCGGRLGWGMNTSRARNLRKNPTDAKRTLWRRLRLRQVAGYKFRKQQPVGQYIVDFVCLEKRLVEVDGGQHGEQMVYDSCVAPGWKET